MMEFKHSLSCIFALASHFVCVLPSSILSLLTIHFEFTLSPRDFLPHSFPSLRLYLSPCVCVCDVAIRFLVLITPSEDINHVLINELAFSGV